MCESDACMNQTCNIFTGECTVIDIEENCCTSNETCGEIEWTTCAVRVCGANNTCDDIRADGAECVVHGDCMTGEDCQNCLCVPASGVTQTQTSFVTEWVGLTIPPNPSSTVTLTRIGDIVHASIGSFTSPNGVDVIGAIRFFSFTVIPVGFRPSITQSAVVTVSNSQLAPTIYTSTVEVDTSGNIFFYRDITRTLTYGGGAIYGCPFTITFTYGA